MATSIRHSSTLKVFVGKVIEIAPKHKAVVQFQLDGKYERALLWYDKIKVDGQLLPQGGTIDQFINKGNDMKFLCHTFDDTGIDRCGWYITSAWRLEIRDFTLIRYETVFNGLYNYTGHVMHMEKRKGVLTFNLNGKEENVLFLGSKLFMYGKRVPARINLSQMSGLEEGRPLGFDAVPCDPSDDKHCNWFATVAWKGRKPNMDYDTARPRQETPLSPLEEIKMVTSNPNALFLRCEGMVMKGLTKEYGLALGAIKNNYWETVLFHHSQVAIANRKKISNDLTKIFKEGDWIRLVAAAAPKKTGVKWVASQVRK